MDERSYTVEKPDGKSFRRNRCQLKKSAEKATPIETIVIGDWQHNNESPEEDGSIMTPDDPVTLTSSPTEVSPEVEKRKEDHQLAVQPEKSKSPRVLEELQSILKTMSVRY